MLAPFMEVLDTSVANVALPHIGGNLSATPEEATWVLTSYLVSNAIVLPDGSGLGLVKELRRADPEVSIVVLTGFANIATAIEAIKLGATHYLTKPANADQVVAALLVEGRQVEADLATVVIRGEAEVGGLDGPLDGLDGGGIEGFDEQGAGIRHADGGELDQGGGGAVILDVQALDQSRAGAPGADGHLDFRATVHHAGVVERAGVHDRGRQRAALHGARFVEHHHGLVPHVRLDGVAEHRQLDGRDAEHHP